MSAAESPAQAAFPAAWHTPAAVAVLEAAMQAAALPDPPDDADGEWRCWARPASEAGALGVPVVPMTSPDPTCSPVPVCLGGTGTLLRSDKPV